MLIFDSKKGRFGTQKPKQWGALSAVRSAVFRNAESIGIDPASIAGYWPMWEGSGDTAIDGIKGNNASLVDSPPWGNDGISFVPTTSKLTTSSSVLSSSGTALFGFKSLVAPNLYAKFLIENDTTFQMFRREVDTYFAIAIGGDEIYFDTGSTNVFDGRLNHIGATWNESKGIRQLVVNTKFAAQDNTAFTFPTLGSTLYVANRVDSIRSIGGLYTQLILLSVDLSLDKIGSFHETPYALLEPRPYRSIFIPATVGGVPTLSAPSFVGRIPSTTLAF
jgi:hypothetical protein